MLLKNLLSKVICIGISLSLSYAANAELTQVSVLIQSKNECSGPNHTFSTGEGFTNCYISVLDENDVTQYLSDVIVKYSGDLAHEETSGNYTVTTDDFQFSNTSDDHSSGTWVYNEGVFTYPDIRFWLAKAGSGNTGGFNLFWMVDSNEIPDNCIAGTNNNNLSFACMNLAQSVTTGGWTTPTNSNGSMRDLSHITFFGGLCSENDTNFDTNCGKTSTTEVPEPTSITLFVLAFLGIVARRKTSLHH